MVLASATWYHQLFRSFFFFIDRVVYGFIGDVYELFETIARTTILSQDQIAAVGDRIYDLLAIFMIFKVTLSLITYVVSPNSFNDGKTGIGALTRNVVLVLALLVLVPYAFDLAFKAQVYILRDNVIPKLIFGQSNDDGETQRDASLNSGDAMAYIAMSAFFGPDTLVVPDCVDLYDTESETARLSSSCGGIEYVDENTKWTFTHTTGLSKISKEESDELTETDLNNYIAGVNSKNIGLMFRENIMNARTNDKEYIFSYKYFFSTVAGILIVLLLINFCMDIAVRSIKLSFLQMIAPVPIISFIDPKSGKDGMFKKWYQMCFSTYLSLFIRLFVIYFALYIINIVGDLNFTDMLDGSRQTGNLLSLFIIIGALMFAKQLPKILEGLGLKLDTGGFTLLPFRKVEKDALGGKMLKKPNDLIGKVGKSALLAAPIGAGLFGKKAIGAIDAARNGKGLKQGWNRTHGKLHNNFYKKLDEWAPDSAEARKNERLGREEVAAMHSKWTKGKKVADILKKYNDKKPWDALDGSNQSAYQAIYKNQEFIGSRMNLDRADAKNKILHRISEQTMRGSTVEDALKAEQSNIQKLDLKSQGDLFGMAGLALGANGQLVSTGVVSESQATANFTEMLDKTSKTVAGMEKVHESIRKQNPVDAATEDALKHIKYNTTDPTDQSRRYI